MTAENFTYWLQGFFELTGEVDELTPEQIKMIKDHLGYVFAKTPKHDTGLAYAGLISGSTLSGLSGMTTLTC